MAKFEFGFEEAWFRLILKKLPDNPDLFLPKAVEKAQSILRVGKLKVGAAKAWAESAGIISISSGFKELFCIIRNIGQICRKHLKIHVIKIFSFRTTRLNNNMLYF